MEERMWPLLFTLSAFAQPCLPPAGPESAIPFPAISENYAELKDKFTRLYESGQRLPHRAYWDSSQSSYAADGVGALPASFLAHVTRHLELALARGYADFVFYADLGHGHLEVPESGDLAAALNSPKLKVLYHTAELVHLRDLGGPLPADPWRARRYALRNVLADNETGEDLAALYAAGAPYNTVRSVPGFTEIGTFLVSASAQGCFAYRQGNQIFYYDISFRR